jgi:hypothetical protein
MVLNIISTGLFLLAFFLAYTNNRFIKERLIGEGQVTQLPATRGSKGGTTYKIVASFRDRAGQEHTYRSTFSSSNPGYAVGDPIRICYRENEPESCGIYSFGYRFGPALIIGALAAALAIIRLGYKLGPGLMDSIYQVPAFRG